MLAAALLLVLAAPLGAQELAPWRAIDASTGQISDIAELEQLARDFPDSTSFRLRLLGAQIVADQDDSAIASLVWLRERGHVFPSRQYRQIPERIGGARIAEAREQVVTKAEVITASTLFDTLPAEAGLIESVFVAPSGMEALATSVTARSVFVRGGEGQWIPFAIPDAFALSGLAAAPDGGMGWFASANIDDAPADPQRFTGVYGLTGDFAQLERIPAPTGVTVSDITVGPDGTVYASDPISGGVYRARRGAKALAPLVAPGTLRSPQGLAVSADGKRLYVSDYGYGLAIIDLASGAVSRLVSEVPAALDGIDGLWLHEGELIAVQNGTSPKRIVALALSPDGLRITGRRVLEQRHPEWTEPLGGNVAGGYLYYVATGQWERISRGVFQPDRPPLPTQIRRLRLRP
jgi:hypothetical protein